MLKKFRVLYFGTWGYGKAGLEELLINKNVEIVKIFTKWDLNSPNPYFNQVYELANKTTIETVNTLQEKLPKNSFEQSILNSGEIDFIISCCFDRFFSEKVLKYPKLGAFNIHPSLLPKYRGVKPLENALANNEGVIGVTLHELTEVTDGGDILIQKREAVNGDQKFGSLYDLQCLQARQIIDMFFENPEQFINSKVQQNDSEKSFAPRLPFEIADTDSVTEIVSKAKKHRIFKR